MSDSSLQTSVTSHESRVTIGRITRVIWFDRWGDAVMGVRTPPFIVAHVYCMYDHNDYRTAKQRVTATDSRVVPATLRVQSTADCPGPRRRRHAAHAAP